MKESDFTSVSGDNSNPDFSASGAPIFFGYADRELGFRDSTFVTEYGLDDFRYVLFQGGNENCSDGPASVLLEKGGEQSYWGASSEIDYTLILRNVGSSDSENLTLIETVPEQTVFDQTKNSSGWSCSPDSSAGSICRIDLGVLPAGATREYGFSVKVLPGTPEDRSIYNEAEVGATPGSPLSAPFLRFFGTPSGNICSVTPHSPFDELFDGSAAACAFFLSKLESDEVPGGVTANCCLAALFDLLSSECFVPSDLPEDKIAFRTDLMVDRVPPGVLYAFRDNYLQRTVGGRRFIEAYYAYGIEIARASLNDESVISNAKEALLAWYPLILSLGAEENSQNSRNLLSVSSEQISALNRFLDSVENASEDEEFLSLFRSEREKVQGLLSEGVPVNRLVRSLRTLRCADTVSTPSARCLADGIRRASRQVINRRGRSARLLRRNSKRAAKRIRSLIALEESVKRERTLRASRRFTRKAKRAARKARAQRNKRAEYRSMRQDLRTLSRILRRL